MILFCVLPRPHPMAVPCAFVVGSRAFQLLASGFERASCRGLSIGAFLTRYTVGCRFGRRAWGGKSPAGNQPYLLDGHWRRATFSPACHRDSSRELPQQQQQQQCNPTSDGKQLEVLHWPRGSPFGTCAAVPEALDWQPHKFTTTPHTTTDSDHHLARTPRTGPGSTPPIFPGRPTYPSALPHR